MFADRQTDVLVVGAGPVGLLAALALARQGAEVQIVDEEWRTAAHSYALALHPSSLALLDELGVADEIVRQGHRVDVVAFYDESGRRAEIRLRELPTKYPFVVVMPQSTLEGALERRLGEIGIVVQWNHRVSRLLSEGRHAIATVQRRGKESVGYAVALTEWVVEKTFRQKADLVIGADGHGSTVRRLLGIDYAKVGEPELFAVFEFESDFAATNEAHIFLHGAALNVLWPLPDGRLRLSLQVSEPEESLEDRAKSRLAVQIGRSSFPHLTRDHLERLIAERAPWFKGEVGAVLWSLAVQFERRLAERFGRDNVWLAGDAAHMTSPIGVQSMNVGLCEASELGRRFGDVLRRGAPLSTIGEYDRRQTRAWRQLLGVEHAAVAADQADEWVRLHAGRIVPCIPACGDDLRQLARQVGIGLPAFSGDTTGP